MTALVAACVLGLAACAGAPEVPQVQAEATAGPVGVVTAQQAELVRADVAAKLERARTGGDPADAAAAATGPALEVELLRQRVDAAAAGEPAAELPGPDPSAAPDAPAPSPGTAEPLEPDSLAPAELVVSPQQEGWPRWFAAVAVPRAGTADDSAGDGADGADGAAAGDASEPPVLEVYVSADPREPYLLWGRAALLPGAEVPSFPAAATGTPAVDVVPAETYTDAAAAEEAEDPGAEGAEDAGGAEGAEDADAVDPGLRSALEVLLPGYVSVLGSGDSSPAAAAFEPDPFVQALQDRAAAERAAVADVAQVTVSAAPFAVDDGPGTLLAARTLDGDVLAVTAVTTTTTTTVRTGTGTVRPGPAVQAATGIEATDGTLTVRSVAVLAFVVPEERGAVRLVAAGEDLVDAEAR